MKRFFIAVAFLTAAVTAFADMVNLPKIKLAYVEENVQISPTGNVVEVSVSEKKSSGNTASDILSVPGKQFLWTPSELTSRATGGADIYCSLLSADGSALVICERIGGSGKPNGLRFIVLDTNSGKIIRASGIIKQKLHYAFMISNTEILAVVSSPGDRNEKMVLARIGIIDELVVPSDVIVSPECRFAASESRIYVYHPEEKNICVYSIDDFSPVAACNITNFSVNGITLSQDNSKLAVFGDGTVEIFNAEIHNNTLYSQEKYNVPNSRFSQCAAVSDNIFVFFAPEFNAHVLLSRQLVPLNIRCGEIFTVHRETGTLAIENRAREFEIFRFPELTPVHKYAPRKMRPVSRNDNNAVFFVPGKADNRMILCDHRGNVWKLELNGKRGKKFPIFNVKY